MKSHPFDAVSFVAGLVFTLIGLLFLIPNTPDELLDAVLGIKGWFWPLFLLGIGLVVLVPAILTGLRTGNEDDG